MSGFEIGCVGERYEGNSVTVLLQNRGVSMYVTDGMTGVGIATVTPAQARELGTLLIHAADNHDELVSRKKQIEEEQERSLISGALSGDRAASQDLRAARSYMKQEPPNIRYAVMKLIEVVSALGEAEQRPPVSPSDSPVGGSDD